MSAAAFFGCLIGILSATLIGHAVWPDPPLEFVFGVLLGTGLTGAALGEVAYRDFR